MGKEKQLFLHFNDFDNRMQRISVAKTIVVLTTGRRKLTKSRRYIICIHHIPLGWANKVGLDI
jgi:hypothetical protein